jgi:TusA-related sulfurtransferase
MVDSSSPAPAVLDLRGVPCPLAWARAKVRLEAFRPGARVDLLTDDARTLRDLPRAAEAAGHHVLDVETGPDGARIRLEV